MTVNYHNDLQDAPKTAGFWSTIRSSFWFCAGVVAIILMLTFFIMAVSEKANAEVIDHGDYTETHNPDGTVQIDYKAGVALDIDVCYQKSKCDPDKVANNQAVFLGQDENGQPLKDANGNPIMVKSRYTLEVNGFQWKNPENPLAAETMVSGIAEGLDLRHDGNGGYYSQTVVDNSAGVAANAEAIAQGTEAIIFLAEGVVTNAAGIATNAEGIATNAEGIATNAEGIATNAEGIATNAEGVAGNAQAITVVADGVATNSLGVANNAQGVAVNATGIAANSERIGGNSQAIATNAEGIANNAQDIQWLSDRVENYRGEYLSGIASAVAMGSIPDAPAGRTSLGIGTGYYGGHSSIAVGFSSSGEHISTKFSAAFSDGENALGAGISYSW